jgi:hypothetical protein
MFQPPGSCARPARSRARQWICVRMVPMLPTCTGGGHGTRYKNGSCYCWLPSTYIPHFIAAHSASNRLSLQALTHQRGACAPSSGPPSFKHASASACINTYSATERFGGTEPACTSRVPVWLVRTLFSIGPSPLEQSPWHADLKKNH